VCVRVGVCMIN